MSQSVPDPVESIREALMEIAFQSEGEEGNCPGIAQRVLPDVLALQAQIERASALVPKWREKALQLNYGMSTLPVQAKQLLACADELERALAAPIEEERPDFQSFADPIGIGGSGPTGREEEATDTTSSDG